MRALTQLVLSQRVVVLHGATGVGKTSLIAGGVIPDLAPRADVLPVLNIDALAAATGDSARHSNPYLGLFADALAARVADANAERPRLPELLARARRAAPGFGPPSRVLVVDQLEELFVARGERAAAQRDDFLLQLGDALREDSHLHLILVVAHDSLPALLQAASSLPDRLAVRFHLEPLKHETAVEVARSTLEASSRSFDRSTAEELARLAAAASSRVAADRSDTSHADVDPILFQAIGMMLWEDLDGDANSDGGNHRELTESNGEALDSLYELLMKRASAEPGLSEPAAREWVESHLISPLGTRCEVQPAPIGATDPLAALGPILEAAGFVEHRAGASAAGAIRLSHDRLIPRILSSNRRYFARRRLIRRAAAALGAALFLVAVFGSTSAVLVADKLLNRPVSGFDAQVTACSQPGSKTGIRFTWSLPTSGDDAPTLSYFDYVIKPRDPTNPYIYIEEFAPGMHRFSLEFRNQKRTFVLRLREAEEREPCSSGE